MNHIARFASVTVFAGAGLFSLVALAQVPATPPSDPPVTASGTAPPTLKLADVEAALAAIEADSGIEDAVKVLLRPKYTDAIEALKQAAEFTGKAKTFRDAIESAPKRSAENRAELEGLPSLVDAGKVKAVDDVDELEQDVASRRSELTVLASELATVSAELVEVAKSPVEIERRKADAQGELSKKLEELASPEFSEDGLPPATVAQRILLQALYARLSAEAEMLEQERLSQSARENQLDSREDLLTRKSENAEAALHTLEAVLHHRLMGEAARFSALVESLIQQLPKGDAAAAALGAELQELAEDYGKVVENLKKVKAARDTATTRLADLTTDYDSIREQLELAGGGIAMVQVMYDLQSHVLNSRAELDTIPLPALDETRLASLKVRGRIREQSDKEKQFAASKSAAVLQLVALRRDVLTKMRAHYGSLFRDLAALEGDNHLYLVKAEEVRDFVSEQLFGLSMRSCTPLNRETVLDLPAGLAWAFGRNHWSEVGLALRGVYQKMPIAVIACLLPTVLLLLFRRSVVAAIEKTGIRTRKISTDRYGHTLAALAWTILLALPIPVLLGLTGWALDQAPVSSDWMQGLAEGLSLAAGVSFATALTAAVCRRGGLGSAHFGWKEATLIRIRRAIVGFAVVYIPALIMTVSCVYGEASQYFQSVGRMSFLLAHAWTAILLWRVSQTPNGILAMLSREHATHLVTRWRFAWFALLLACPLILIVLACSGYLITATKWSLGLITTTGLIAGGELLHALTLRWFKIKQRRLALAEALERRRARQEAATSHAEAGTAAEVIAVEPEFDEELNLESISAQTRSLLRSLFTLFVAIGIILFWSQTFPLIALVDSIKIPLTGLSLLAVVQTVLILAVTQIAVKNLPGLLELAVLRATTFDAGVRNAITTLCRYAVTAAGVALLFNVLQVDWAKFGWVAAALSVGLGFGLQEVVANFVCGLILLFERPIRVGDVVTLDGTTGTVIKIQMRATTITNWDRQDLVVPNKSLITGTILNWTLSAPLSRLVIPVGVAYGSDTDKARQILLDVATEHPHVLSDPPPLASFEAFADSSLNLVLRAYLPDLDNRIKTMTELNTEINERFAAANIEIAFPQRDLHLRGGFEPALPATESMIERKDFSSRPQAESVKN